jgi:hypothetical protein
LHSTTDKHLYLSQRIKLAGYGSTTFAASLAKTEEIYEFFARHFAIGSMADWQCPTVANEAVITASTRYFTPRSDAPGARDMMFAPGVDPMGYLHGLKSNELIHIEDNRINYLRKTTNPLTG